jgi:hypothetical protein
LQGQSTTAGKSSAAAAAVNPILPGTVPPGTTITPTTPLLQGKSAAAATPAISSTVMGVDGKTYYIGSNGSLLYRGQDGGLHVFGSGAAE